MLVNKLTNDSCPIVRPVFSSSGRLRARLVVLHGRGVLVAAAEPDRGRRLL